MRFLRSTHRVWAFENKAEAERFYKELKERLTRFKLELAEEKTKFIEFDRDKPKKRFDFLGFEFFWGLNKRGEPHLKKRTSGKRLRESIAKFHNWMKFHRNTPIKYVFLKINRMLRGYYNYFGTIGNYQRLFEYFKKVIFSIKKWLSRRSQRGKINWPKMNRLVEQHGLIKPHITERKGNPKSIKRAFRY